MKVSPLTGIDTSHVEFLRHRQWTITFIYSTPETRSSDGSVLPGAEIQL